MATEEENNKAREELAKMPVISRADLMSSLATAKLQEHFVHIFKSPDDLKMVLTILQMCIKSHLVLHAKYELALSKLSDDRLKEILTTEEK